MAEVIAWLDSARWSPENQTAIIWGPVNLPSPSQSLLVHWLTYITDIQRPWQNVWNFGQRVFAEIVRSFSIQNFQASGDVHQTLCHVQRFLDAFREEQQTGKVRAFRCRDIKYTPRFPNQHDFIERTLTLLAHDFSKNFVRFMVESIHAWSAAQDGLGNVARDLYFLTYSKHPLEESVRLFKNRANYPPWKRFGNKRVWASLRDYRKSPIHLELFHQGLIETQGSTKGDELFKTWITSESFRLRFLELPGDVWNIQFLKKLVEPLAKDHNILLKSSWPASRKAREIYNEMGENSFYPEQLDVSFDLSSKTCENGMCSVCPFGPTDLVRLCLKENPDTARNKYCPVLLATCQYRTRCDPESCPIAKNIGKQLCQGPV